METFMRNLLRKYCHQEWLRFGLRDRVARVLHEPDSAKSEAFTVPFFGGQYRGDFSTFLDWSVYYYGAYAREELRLMEDVLALSPTPFVMDVGANVGHHTLFAALHAKQVYAFEPFDGVASQLKSKLADNRRQNVKLFEFALGNCNEVLTYVKPDSANTGTGSFTLPTAGKDTLELPIKLGDEVMANESPERIDFVKIDVEGFEPQVLEGLKETLAKHRPVVFFEWNHEGRRDFLRDPASLFPEDFTFFEFQDDAVIAIFFRKPTYQLKPITGPWPEANIVAVPREKVASMRHIAM